MARMPHVNTFFTWQQSLWYFFCLVTGGIGVLYPIRFYTRQFYAVVNNHIFEQITGSRTYDVLRFCVLPIVSLVHFLCMLLSARVPLAHGHLLQYIYRCSSPARQFGGLPGTRDALLVSLWRLGVARPPWHCLRSLLYGMFIKTCPIQIHIPLGGNKFVCIYSASGLSLRSKHK